MIALRVTEELRHGIVGGIVASRAYLERRGRPKTPQDLKRHNCIRIRLSSGALLPWRFARKGRPLEVAVVFAREGVQPEAPPHGGGITTDVVARSIKRCDPLLVRRRRPRPARVPSVRNLGRQPQQRAAIFPGELAVDP